MTKIILTCFAELEVRGVLEGFIGALFGAFGPRGRGARVPARGSPLPAEYSGLPARDDHESSRVGIES